MKALKVERTLLYENNWKEAHVAVEQRAWPRLWKI